MSRTDCNQAAQRAKVSHRRKRRGPPEMKHGGRSQSGIKIRSGEAWKAYLAYRKILVGEQNRLEAMREKWRTREAEKRA